MTRRQRNAASSRRHDHKYGAAIERGHVKMMRLLERGMQPTPTVDAMRAAAKARKRRLGLVGRGY